MATSDDFTRIAISLPGTTSAPHFDRTAFKVRRIYATLSGDGRSANLNFSPDEQEFKVQVAPELFKAIDNAWGRSGWTMMTFEEASEEDVLAALTIAHANGAAKKR